MNKKFSFDQKQARALYDAGQNDSQIGAALDVSPRTIARWRRKNDLPGIMRVQIDEAKARELLEKGYTIRHVADYFSVSTHAIHNFIRREGMYPPCLRSGIVLDTNKALELYNEGHSDITIAQLCNVPVQAVSTWRAQEDLPSQKRLNQSKYDQMSSLYNDGLSDAQIAAQLGCSAQSVYRFRKKQNLPAHRQTNRVYSSGDTPATWNKEEALQLYKQGLSDRKIAEKLGIAHSTIGQWRRAQGLPATGRPGQPKRDVPD